MKHKMMRVLLKGMFVGMVALTAISMTGCGKEKEDAVSEEDFPDDLVPLDEDELKEIENAGSGTVESDDEMIIPEDEMLEQWADAEEDAEEMEDSGILGKDTEE